VLAVEFYVPALGGEEEWQEKLDESAAVGFADRLDLDAHRPRRNPGTA